MTVYVLPPRTPPIGRSVNVTSNSKDFGRGLSPFLLGPVDLYSGMSSQNVENAWQYSKVYANHISTTGNPTEHYFEWAIQGWNSVRANRYPMGKGALPEYSYWDGDRLGYIEARKSIYLPVYQAAVLRRASNLLDTLWQISQEGDLTIIDYDAYNHHDLGLTLYGVLNNPNRKMGHGFALAMLIQ